MSQHEHTVAQTRMFLENMVGFAMRASSAGLQVSPGQVVDSTIGKIIEIAEQHFPLSRVLDCSDIVLHAEGPGAANSMPWLSALNWVTATAEQNIRQLSIAYFDMKGANGKEIVKNLDPRLTGLAPGSLWIGIKIDGAPNQFFGEASQGDDSLSEQIRNLPAIARFIEDEGMRAGLEEVSPDPAMRDISLGALLKFSPTGRKGIHTLEIATPTEGMVSLSQRERVVLKEAIAKPSMTRSLPGSFVGQIREADLDKARLHLRSVANVGTLRCVVPELNARQASALLGKHVRAVGNYQTDSTGRPRMLFVERFEEVRGAPEDQSGLEETEGE
jgi:hypothetical protein